MSIESVGATSNSIQDLPGPAAAGSNPPASLTVPSVSSPRTSTPSPPPAKAQQSSQPESQPQQLEQQPLPPHQASPSRSQSPALQIAATTEKAPVASTSSPALSTSAAASQPPPRPPPPASAVSLHDAAAKAAAAAAAAAAAKPNVAGGAAPDAAAPIAPKQLTEQTGTSSTPSGQQPQNSTNTAVSSPTKLDANGTAKKPPRAKVNKPPGATKPKQKRRANQSGLHDELVYRPGPSTAGGTIGAAPDSTIPAMLTAAGGGRKALPELVLPFQLPFTDVRPEMPMLDNASVQAAMAMGASETSSPDTNSDSDDYSVMSENSDLDSEAEESRKEARRRRKEPATIEESLILLQSLRQSRLSHLSSLLTPFSQRVRSGMIYPNVLPLSLLHGLNPREPHVLIQLGRADIHVGPHIFMKTKFWEVRPDYEVPPVMDPVTGMRVPGSFGAPPTYAPMAATQPLPQQLPKPQPPQLPSPRTISTVPQPGAPLARPPTTANKTSIVRPSPAATPASTTSAAQSSAASTQPASKSAGATTPTAMPTPTLPAAPIPSSTGVSAASPAAAPTKSSIPVPPTTQVATAPATTSVSALATTTAPLVKPATGSPANSVTVSSSSKAAPAPGSSTATVAAAVPAVTSAPAPAPASAASASPSANVETKPASIVPAPVTLAPKPLAVPVSLPRPPMATPSLPRPPSINQNNIPSSANPAASSTGVAASGATAKAPAQSAAPLVKPASTLSNAGASGSAPPTAASSATAGTAAASGSAPQKAAGNQASASASTAARPVATATSNATGTPATPAARPGGPPPPPAIDAVLVSRVNATAALNPELQELLHIAASGKANPNQLKALGVWIQAITAQLRQDEARNAAAVNNAAGASSSRAEAAASTTAEGKKPKKAKVDDAAKASKKQAKIEEREAKKKAKAEAKAKAQADKQLAQKQQKEKQMLQQQQQQQQPSVSNKLRHAPPGWPTDGPPKPPVIVVEFRENPSMRFILPLWKCLVERTEGVERPSIPKVKKERRSFFDNDSDDEGPQRIEPELKLSFFAPSLGSDAADGSGLRELEEELKRKAAQEAKLSTANAPSPAPQGNGAANGAANTAASPDATSSVTEKSDDAAATNGKKKKAGAASGKKSSKAIKQEVNDVSLASDYSQSKKHEVYPLTWSIKGGVTESLWEAFGRVPGTMTCQPVKREPEIELEPDVAEFLVPEIRYHLLDLPMEEIKIQKETSETFADLYSQMPDRRFVVPRVAPALLPQGLEDHLQDRFAVRPQCIQGRPMVKRKAGAREEDVSFSYEGIGLTVIGPNGVKMEPGATPPKPPKRKRHVATHNPDGSIKSCGACGKTKTPMWRRGPKGPSQLCNACGARWKAGRLVVPEVAPPPIIEAEEDKSKEEETRKEDEVKASMHGSNALVIPQSSGIDDGSYAVMSSSGLVGATPFSDHGGAGIFSLSSDGKSGGLDFGSSHLGRGSSSPSPFIRSPIPEDEVMPASVDPSMLSGSIRVSSHRR